MDLTVQEIIAKVALRRESQLKQQHKKDILTKINYLNIQSSNLIKDKNHHKFQIISNINNQHQNHISKAKRNNPQNLDSFQNQISNKSILIEKHKKLKTIYQKLKNKIEHQSQINELYTETIKKLQIVLKKNKKLQKELDSIRSKRSVISKKSQQIKDQSSNVRSSVFYTNSVSVQKQTRFKELNKLSKQSRLNQLKGMNKVQYSYQINKKYDVFDQNIAKLQTNQNNQCYQSPNNFSNNNKQVKQISQFKIEYKKPSYNSWCKNEIEQYKLMIVEKEASIMKLRSMVEKQQKIIRNYVNISSTDIIKQKQGSIISANNQNIKGKNVQKKGQNIQGTIVKLNRLKNNGLYAKMNKVQTDTTNMRNNNKNHNNNKNDVNIDSLDSYMDGKTKKKVEQRERFNKQKLIDNLLQDTQQFKYQYQQYCSNMIKENSNNCEYQQQQQEEFNETSEFICQI